MSNDLTLVEYEGNVIQVDRNGLAWMSQKQIGEWLGLSKNAISQAVRAALESNAPQIASERLGIPVVQTLGTTANDGKTYQVEHYNFLLVSMVAMRANRSENALTFQVWALEQIARSFMAEMNGRIKSLESELSSEANARRSAEMRTEWLETKEQMRTRAIDRRYEEYE